MNSLDEKWNAVPEWARWLLWLPLSFLFTASIVLVTTLPVRFSLGFGAEWLAELLGSFLSSCCLIPTIYILVPRFKKAVSSAFFLLILIFSILAIARVGLLLFLAGEHVTHPDLIDLLRGVVWMTVGTGAFMACMRGRFDGEVAK